MRFPPLVKHLSLFSLNHLQPFSDYEVMPDTYSLLTPNKLQASVTSALKLRINGDLQSHEAPFPWQQPLNQNTMASQVATQLRWLLARSSSSSINPWKTCLRFDQGWRLRSQTAWNLQTNSSVFLVHIPNRRPHPLKSILGAARAEQPGWPKACSAHSLDLFHAEWEIADKVELVINSGPQS